MLDDKGIDQIIVRTIEKKGWIDLPAQGMSMYPFIIKGDICRFVRIEASVMKVGDVLLFRAKHGHLIAHRLTQTVMNNQQPHYLCKGDTNVTHDEWIAQDQIIGTLIWINRHGRLIRMTNLASRMWSWAIRSLPLLSRLVQCLVRSQLAKS
ncbi:signal peptidase I [Paenibacillus oryzisoli]|uniref:Signal peptidase I n=1 Tax=Paenibacillus oryzisoli TaxID=1850517 RepID=A0A198A6Y2_9BACL|nr:signal peptidase I [Paenibacillus oryzisoli]OAS17224.1 signal peptidase I [Paenibacillus oryzisoli]